jgi:putative Holliday junction resolvase
MSFVQVFDYRFNCGDKFGYPDQGPVFPYLSNQNFPIFHTIPQCNRVVELPCAKNSQKLCTFAKNPMGRIVAIDYGKKRCGIAVTDELRIIATGLTTVETPSLMAFLKSYCDANSVSCFVVGEPRQMNNTPSESAVLIEPFVKGLEKAFTSIPVRRYDERFTSLLATRAIREAGLKKKDRQDKALVDTVSATILLQSYMESIK